MLDYFENFKKQKQINEGLFDKILPKKKENNFFSKDTNGGYIFGGKSFAQDVNPGDLMLQQFPWEDSKLAFIGYPDTKFNAEVINFNLDKEEISYFRGTWGSGPFVGQKFAGIFQGSSFEGNFFAPYTNYKSSPETFVKGTFEDTTNQGILGLPNTVVMPNQPFNIITIPPGYMLQFKSNSGKNSYIKVIKRLDKYGAGFVFEVLDGINHKTQPEVKNLDWNEIRNNWKTRIYEISIDSKNIAGLITIPNDDSIAKMYISKSPSLDFKPTSNSINPSGSNSTFEPGKKYTFDISKIPNLNITSIRGEKGRLNGPTSPVVYLDFSSPGEYNQYLNVISNIQSGNFSQDLKNISKAYKYGEIDGYGPYSYLSKIFNTKGVALKEANTKKKNISVGQQYAFKLPKKSKKIGNQTPLNTSQSAIQSIQKADSQPEIKQSLARLNSFIYYFVENLVTAKGLPNENAKKIIISKLKQAIGIEPILNHPVISQKNSNGDYGAHPNDFSGSSMSEGLRKAVRGIINDNF